MGKRINRKNFERLLIQIREFISEQGNTIFNHKTVAHGLGITAPLQIEDVAMILEALAYEGDIAEVTPGRYKSLICANVTTGRFIRRSNGTNSVITDDGEQVSVTERNSMHAFNGDKVRVSIAAHTSGYEPEAKVIEIIEKKEQTFIGTIKVEKNFGYLMADSRFLATDILIPKNKLKGAKTGDKVIVRITGWPNDYKNPRGEIVDILGKAGDNDTEIHAILAEFGLPYQYPENVDAAAQKIKAGITKEEIAKRIDMRDAVTFTIDPKDAKDFDDALSLRTLQNGNYEVGVHIADVTHYVKPDTLLDKEAEKRATSVYLVDRVVPMLPEHLSNGICSLRPEEEKLTFSCIFEMTATGKVVNSQIGRTVIKSNRRFTYEEAQDIIETGAGDFKDEIQILDQLAKILRKNRFENGSIDFDRTEVRFDIDENGHPTGVYFKESKDANKLIEEFMLLANKTVAQYVGDVKGSGKRARAFVYRVHDQPDPVKLEDLSRLSRTFGYRLRSQGSSKDINNSINRLMKDVKGKGEENLLSTLAVKCMAKAKYTTENIGHYGLGFNYYTHFTSPIRRYPDMMVHRLIERYLSGGRSVNVAKLEEQCKHSSDMEQLAANAERASIKHKQVEYLNDHIGEVYDGVISGVTEWGFYVELDENKCEGLVSIRDLTGDYYDFDEKNYCLIGRRNNIIYRLGDKVKIKVANANFERKQLDFTLVDSRIQLRNEDEAGYTLPVSQVLNHKRSDLRPSNKKNLGKKRHK